jgi:hypothetical protein
VHGAIEWAGYLDGGLEDANDLAGIGDLLVHQQDAAVVILGNLRGEGRKGERRREERGEGVRNERGQGRERGGGEAPETREEKWQKNEWRRRRDERVCVVSHSPCALGL